MKIRPALCLQRFLCVAAISVCAYSNGVSAPHTALAEEPNASTVEISNIHSTFSGDPRFEVTVSWRTLTPIECPTVQFTDETENWMVRTGTSIISGGGHSHHVKLSGLAPGTSYRYRIQDGAGGWSPTCRFRTLPDPAGSISFAVVGDVQGKDAPSGIWKQAAEFLETQHELAFTVLVGDLVDIGGDQRHWDAFFNPATGEVTQPLFRTMPVMPIPGNHDYYAIDSEGRRNDTGIRLFLDQFRLPPNGLFEKWNGCFYSLKTDFATLVMLDTEGAQETRSSMLADQSAWLSDLTFEDTPWNLAFLHRPVYPFLRHTPSEVARSLWRPHVFDPHVNVVFSGHNHAHAVSAKLSAVSLEGLDGGHGFTGHWRLAPETPRDETYPPLLLLEEGDVIAYNGCATAGRSVYTLPQGTLNASPIRMIRPVVPIDTAEKTELWIGFLHKKLEGWYAADQGGFRLSAKADQTHRLQIDTTRTEAPDTGRMGRFRITVDNCEAVSQRAIAREGREHIPDEPFFVLARFLFEDGTIRGFLKHIQSPENLPNESPTEWDATIIVREAPERVFDTLTLLGDSPRRTSLLDELRIGGDLASVLPPRIDTPWTSTAWVEERFDTVPTITPDTGVIYYDAGGINHSGPPADFWYIRQRQKRGMRLVSIVDVDAETLTVKTVLFADFGDWKAGDILHSFTLRRDRRRH